MTLNEIQKQLKVPKNQKNSFGGYMYRNCEDILEAVKPLLGDSILTLTDEVLCVGSNNYVKATAVWMEKVIEVSAIGGALGQMSIGGEKWQETKVTAYAREADEQKGMSPSQITGSASSYARKYALNGLFLIDDTKDDEAREHAPVSKKASVPSKTPYQLAQGAIKACKDGMQLESVVIRIKTSTTFTEQEKNNLLTEADFQASELEL